MPAWCRKMGQEFLGLEEDGGIFKAYVRKTGKRG
jgi:TusA-related sulfurtransferase